MPRDEQLAKLKEAVSSTKAAYRKAETELKQYQKAKEKEAKQAKANKVKAAAAKQKTTKNPPVPKK